MINALIAFAGFLAAKEATSDSGRLLGSAVAGVFLNRMVQEFDK